MAMATEKKLNDADLRGLVVRTQTLDIARNQLAMMQEAHQAYVQLLGKRYKIKGKFNINTQTGIITPISVPSNGHDNITNIQDLKQDA